MEHAEIIFPIIAGTSVMIILVMVIVLFIIQYNRKISLKESVHAMEIKNKELELLRKIIEVQENERETIATNLHDEVGPLLSTLKLNISRYKKKLSKKSLLESDLDEERLFIDQVIDNVRSVSHDLSPQFLLKFGLVKAIENFIKTIPDTTFSFHYPEDISEISKQTSINIYRITLELLNNLLKYDQPKKVVIHITIESNQLILTIKHDSDGITNEEFREFAKTSKGMGLTSMQSRVLIINGNLSFRKSDQPRITLTAPLNLE